MPRRPSADRIEYLAFRGALFLFRLMPYVLAERMLAAMGVLACDVLRIRRSTVVGNLRQVYPEWPKKRINSLVREIYRQVGITIAETYLAPDSVMERRVAFDGWESLEHAMARGKGVLVVSAHLGNWELGGRWMATHGMPLYAVVKPPHNHLFDEYTCRMRERAGIRHIFTKKSVRSILWALSEDGIVVILAAQNARRDGLRLNFLGRPASVHVGPARIALMTGTPVLCIFDMRKPDGTHIISIEEPIIPQGDASDEAAVTALTMRLSERAQARIRACPGQWLWLHNRWKNPARAHPPVMPKEEA